MKIKYSWDVVKVTISGGGGTSYGAYKIGDDPTTNLDIFWSLIPLWGFIWLGIGLLGAVFVLVPPLMKLVNMEPINAPLSLIGLIAGLIATIVEYNLFLLLFLLEDWKTFSTELNFILQSCFIIGWVALIIGSYFPTKD
ncbi:MAG: hypothetical protein ACFFDT_34300 [Candidatus Hodarchaeota archaeon]